MVWIEGGEETHRLFQSPRPFVEIASGSPDVSYVDAMQRRRLSRLSRALLHARDDAGLGENTFESSWHLAMEILDKLWKC